MTYASYIGFVAISVMLTAGVAGGLRSFGTAWLDETLHNRRAPQYSTRRQPPISASPASLPGTLHGLSCG